MGWLFLVMCVVFFCRVGWLGFLLVGLFGLFGLGGVVGAGEVRGPRGFEVLFNGRDLSGWHGMGHFDLRRLKEMSVEERRAFREEGMESVREHWRVEGGVIVNDGEGVYLTSDRVFGDVELLLDYRTVAGADSGVYLRGNPQVQIWDFTEEGGKWDLGADRGSGGLWNNSPGSPGRDPLVLADRAFGEWNRFRIVQVGDRVSVFLNGRLVVDHAVMENFWDRGSPLWREGPIQLQTHGGRIEWRNVFVREILDWEAGLMLAEPGFKVIFNGRDFTGWEGAVDGYVVEDGALVCREGSGGTVYYHQVFGDFVMRFEFRLPPGGNNGLVVRYPGSGDGAYVGMCELQVLDNSAARFGGLDGRQVHGSAYGMAGARRGFLRPVGEWNFQEVRVEGSEVRVALNGAVVLDVDLDGVEEFMDGRAHPGRGRRSGFVGFAGHGDAVAFRRVRVRALR